jgi:hypothetical protein
METETIRLWTIQHRDAWSLAERTGILRANGRRVWSSFRPAYGWMRDQMRLRITGAGGRYPIWAWAYPKPDLRCAGHLEPGTPGVCIECRAPASTVLLSDFDAWHHVLNESYLSLNDEEDESWESRTGHRRYAELSSAEQAEIRKSWDRIFDLSALLAAPAWHKGETSTQYIQATVEEVPLGWVTSVRPFIAR